jgi:hypothetical protein
MYVLCGNGLYIVFSGGKLQFCMTCLCVIQFMLSVYVVSVVDDSGYCLGVIQMVTNAIMIGSCVSDRF